MPTSKAILDTNVFVGSGFNSGSASRKLVDAIRSGELVLVWNEETRRETLAVLRKIPPLSHEDVEALFGEEGRWDGETHPEEFELVEDPTDRKFAALAHAAGVPVVTNDDDLLGPREQLPVEVFTPSEFAS
jgi:predicted nucleic acid-binding protein